MLLLLQKLLSLVVVLVVVAPPPRANAMSAFFSSLMSSTPESDECLAEPESGEPIASGNYGSVRLMKGNHDYVVKTVSNPKAYEDELKGGDLALEFVLLEGKSHEAARRQHIYAPVLISDPEEKREASSHCDSKRLIYYPKAQGKELIKTSGKYPADVHGVFMLVTVLFDLVRTVCVMANGHTSSPSLLRWFIRLFKKPEGAEKGITHNDIKPDNIFFHVKTLENGLQVGTAALIDLGLIDVKYSQITTKLYVLAMTPSMVHGETVAHPFEDLFRIAHTAVHLVTGQNPIEAAFHRDKINWIHLSDDSEKSRLRSKFFDSLKDANGQLKDFGGAKVGEAEDHGWLNVEHHKQWVDWWTTAFKTTRTADQARFVEASKEWIMAFLYSSERDRKKWDDCVKEAFERGETLVAMAATVIGPVGKQSWSIVDGLSSVGPEQAAIRTHVNDENYEHMSDHSESGYIFSHEESHEDTPYESPGSTEASPYESPGSMGASTHSSHLTHGNNQYALTA